MITVKKYDTDDGARNFIAECEAHFERSVLNAASYIASVEDCRAVTLAGPTCSGKTTFAFRLIGALRDLGKRAILVSIDDFYRSREDMIRLGINNFEGVSAIDTDCFRKTASDLANFREALMPKYDFALKKRASLTPYTPSKNDIFIFEGIQAIYPEILRCLDPFESVSVYICVEEGVTVSNISFEPCEMRLMRRVVRDHYHRGTSVADTMVLWNNVRHNEETNIFPYVGSEDVTVNSLLPYEIFVVGKEFLAISDEYPADGMNSPVIYSLRERLLKVVNDCFSVDLIPESSLLQEFSK